MGRAAARRGKNCVLTDIYGKAIDALIGSIVKKGDPNLLKFLRPFNEPQFFLNGCTLRSFHFLRICRLSSRPSIFLSSSVPFYQSMRRVEA